MIAASEATVVGNLQSQEELAPIDNARRLSISTRLPNCNTKISSRYT